MAIWKDSSAARRDGSTTTADPSLRVEETPRAEVAANFEPPRRATQQAKAESLIAAGLTIEGKIEGSGHVRIAGRFKGDVNVQGHLTIEAGAKVTGGVRADTVIIGGELEGNIDAASRVELLDSGVLNGDLKAGSLTVAAGSRMRGHAEFGWEPSGAPKAGSNGVTA
jgi:cytoskeletal protein CcmA (bactofilin family)